MKAPHPASVYGEVKDAFLRYYDTAFHIRDAGLEAERRSLLEVMIVSSRVRKFSLVVRGPEPRNVCFQSTSL